MSKPKPGLRKYMVMGTVTVSCSIDVIASSEAEALRLADDAGGREWMFNQSHPEGPVSVDCIGRTEQAPEDAEIGVL